MPAGSRSRLSRVRSDSTSAFGQSSINVEFEAGSDIDVAAADVSNAILRAVDLLPADARRSTGDDHLVERGERRFWFGDPEAADALRSGVSALELVADLHPSAAAHFSQEEERWAIPVGMDVVVMYYNVDLFDQYGVPYPELGWTWEDFFEKAIALRDPGGAYLGTLEVSQDLTGKRALEGEQRLLSYDDEESSE